MAIGGEARGFVQRVYENRGIQEAIQEISSDENVGPVIGALRRLTNTQSSKRDPNDLKDDEDEEDEGDQYGLDKVR